MIIEDPDLPRYTSSPAETSIIISNGLNGSRNDPPPAYNAPTSYKIGNNIVPQSLVTIKQLKAHLGLLRAFKELKTKVQESEPATLQLPEVVEDLNKEKRWTWFVGLAVERFQRWLKTIKPESNVESWIERNIPPIDVLMVWHAYYLNPSWYMEDTERLMILRELKNVGSHFPEIVAIAADGIYQPSLERMGEWHKSTGTYYDPIESLSFLSHRDVECPRCDTKISVPLITAGATGYLQPDFSYPCDKCRFKITKESLAIDKLARDLLGCHDSSIYRAPYGDFIAGTLYSIFKLKDPHTAQEIQKALLSNPLFAKPANMDVESDFQVRSRLFARSGGSLGTIKNAILKSLRVGGIVRTNKIMSAYTDDRPFSVDLVGAVIRQGSFVDKMHNLCWTEPTYFSSAADEIVLVHATARYHAFLDLMSSSLTSFFVPTLDIDLVWHTHQMMGPKYGEDCLKWVKRFIDHNDQVEDELLSVSLDLTCRAWQKRFGLPYMHCGCPLPGDSIGSRLSRMTTKAKSTGNSLEPPRRSDALSATHPSDHDCVVVPNTDPKLTEQARQKRLEKIKKRQEKEAKEKGKKGERDRVLDHEYAFLYPVPLYYPPVVACAAVSTGFVATTANCGGAAPCGGGTYGMGASGGGGGGCGGGGCGGGGCGGG